MKITFTAGVLALVFPLLAVSQPSEPPAADFNATTVFLLDASLGSDAGAYAGRLERLKKTLESEPGIKRFNVLLFDVAGRWVEPDGFLKNDAETRDKVLKDLASVAPEGACDLAAALDRATAKRSACLSRSGPRL